MQEMQRMSTILFITQATNKIKNPKSLFSHDLPIITLHTDIKVPINRCFDLSRSIDLHKISTEHTKEDAIDGVTSGLIKLNESVTWRAVHFGISQTLSTKITEFERPAFFADEMVKGAFKSFRHEHHFESTESGTRMTDRFDYESPFPRHEIPYLRYAT